MTAISASSGWSRRHEKRACRCRLDQDPPRPLDQLVALADARDAEYRGGGDLRHRELGRAAHNVRTYFGWVLTSEAIAAYWSATA